MKTLFLLPFLFAATPQTQNDPNTVVQNSRPLTFVGPRSGEGYFSADGKKMIFQSERENGNPFYQMYILDLLSGKSQRVSPGVGKTTCGWIHPTGQKVMWSSTHLDGKSKEKAKEEYDNRAKAVKARYSWNYDETYDIFESDLKGTRLKRLTHEKGYDAEGSYSPDGKWIAFASNRAGYTEKLSPEDAALFQKDPSYLMDIYLMKADGSSVRRLTDAKGYDGGPFFSADGRKITWRRFSPNGATAEIYTMNVDGSDQKAITHLNSMSWAPFFHPSGDYVIFTSSVLGFANFELFVVDTEGKKNPVRVTFAEGFDGLPTFTPDGLQMSWTHRNEKGESQILISDWDDAQVRKLLALPARSPGPLGLSPEIRASDLRRLVEWMASPEMNGRQTGSAEEKILTAKWEEIFKSWGLIGGAPDGGFLQRFEYTSSVKLGEKSRLQIRGPKTQNLKIGEDAEPYSFSAPGETKEGALIFVGYGIKAPANDKQASYDSYQGVDVKGKWVFVLRDLPEDLPPDRRAHLSLYSRLQHKITVAREAGALGILIGEGTTPLKPTPGHALRFEGALGATSLPAWRVGGAWLEEMVKAQQQKLLDVKKRLDRGELVSFPLTGYFLQGNADLISEKSVGTNVIARLKANRGSGHAVLVGAHGDHLGHGDSGNSLAKGDEIGKTHFGADDNASGVAVLMELAHSLSTKKNRAQDLYFAIWSGEEIGLLGSAAYTKAWDQKQKKSFKQTFTASLNLDMVGRLRDSLQVQGAASGDLWKKLAEEMSARTGLSLSLTDDPYVPTDAMTFYMAGIPSVSFFTGAHGEYHSPRDLPETLNYPGMVRIAGGLQEWLETLTSRPDALVKYQAVASNPNSRMEGRTYRVHLGTIPDYAQEGVKGVRLSGVSKDSPAEKAGLKEKDVIVEFAGTKVENIYDYVYGLQAAKPDIATSIKVLRAGKILELTVTPQLKE